jgi:type I restriction enzyme S subunit
MEMRHIGLGKIIRPADVRRAGNIEYPVLSMTMRDGLVNQGDKFKKRIASADTFSYKVVERNQLVVGFPIDEGVLAFQNLYDEAIVSPAYNIWNLRDNALIDSKYLERYLRSPRALEFYKSRLRSTTARRRSLPNDIFLLLLVPAPPLEEQDWILKLLDGADELLKLRAQADRRAAVLIPALFHEIFGDPAENTRGWKRENFRDLLDRIDGGWSPTCQDRPAQPDEWGVLKLGAVTSCEYVDTENKALPDGVAPRPELEVRVGDLLFTRKNTYQLVAACALVFKTRPKLMLPDLIFRFRLKPTAQLNPTFLWGLLTYPTKRRQVQALAGGSAGSMPNISQGRLVTLPIEIPPLSLQEQFARGVMEIRNLEAEQAASRARLEALSQSLLHRAFNGEL